SVAPKDEANSLSAAAANKRGVAHYQAGEVERGVQAFREAVAKEPAVLEYRLNLGRALNQLGRWGEADSVLSETHAFARGEKAVHIAIARSYQGLGKSDELVERYLRALAERPGDAVLKRNAAAAFLQLGRAEDAVPLARAVVAAIPSDEDAR